MVQDMLTAGVSWICLRTLDMLAYVGYDVYVGYVVCIVITSTYTVIYLYCLDVLNNHSKYRPIR